MSLLNEVLRKLDQQQGAPPSALPPVAAGGRSAGKGPWLVAAVLGVIALTLGTGWWWTLYRGQAPLPAFLAGEAHSPAESRKTGESKAAPGSGGGQAEEAEEAGDIEEVATPEAMEVAESEADGQGADGETDSAEKEGSDGKGSGSGAADSAEPDTAQASNQAEAAEDAGIPYRLAPAGPVKIRVGGEAEAASSDQGAEESGRDGSGARGQTDPPDASVREKEVPAGDRRSVRRAAPQQGEGDAAARGYRLLQSGEVARARDTLERAARHAESPGPALLNNLALARWRARDADAALATFRQGLAAYPGDARLGRNLGRLALGSDSQGHRTRAVRILTQAEAEQAAPGRMALIGALYRSLGRLEASEAAYRRGLAGEGGGDWRARLGLGLTLERAGKTDKAAGAYRRALAELPGRKDGVRGQLEQRLERLQGGGPVGSRRGLRGR